MAKWIVLGKRWFNKPYGNTYHSVEVYDAKTNKLVVSVSKTYGYGDHYKQTAINELIKKGYLPKKDIRNYLSDYKTFIFKVVDVNKQKDLFNYKIFGK